MKILKVLMLLILGLFVYLSLSHLLKLEIPAIGAYWLAIFTIGSFIVYFLVFFLDLEIISKWVSIKRKMNTLENKQKQLSKIVTAFYKYIFISVTYNSSIKDNAKNVLPLMLSIKEEIKEYLDKDDIKSFAGELEKALKK